MHIAILNRHFMNTNPLAKFPGFALKRVSHSAITKLQNELGELGVKLAEASLLVTVDENRGITSAKAGRLLNIASANMAPLSTRLKARKLIDTKPVDGKSQGIYLTRKGQDLVKKVTRVMLAHEAHLMSQIPEHLHGSFIEALEHLSSEAVR